MSICLLRPLLGCCADWSFNTCTFFSRGRKVINVTEIIPRASFQALPVSDPGYKDESWWARFCVFLHRTKPTRINHWRFRCVDMTPDGKSPLICYTTTQRARVPCRLDPVVSVLVLHWYGKAPVQCDIDKPNIAVARSVLNLSKFESIEWCNFRPPVTLNTIVAGTVLTRYWFCCCRWNSELFRSVWCGLCLRVCVRLNNNQHGIQPFSKMMSTKQSKWNRKTGPIWSWGLLIHSHALFRTFLCGSAHRWCVQLASGDQMNS